MSQFEVEEVVIDVDVNNSETTVVEVPSDAVMEVEIADRGLRGLPGIDGDDGLSAYEIAVEEGFVGTEAEWLESLVGAPGSDYLQEVLDGSSLVGYNLSVEDDVIVEFTVDGVQAINPDTDALEPLAYQSDIPDVPVAIWSVHTIYLLDDALEGLIDQSSVGGPPVTEGDIALVISAVNTQGVYSVSTGPWTLIHELVDQDRVQILHNDYIDPWREFSGALVYLHDDEPQFVNRGFFDSLSDDISELSTSFINYVDGELSEVATQLNLKADLVDGVVPAVQLPSYVDDVLEFADVASFPVTGQSGKLYVALDDSKLYRWSGSIYVAIGGGVALGETSSTAYRGDRGKTAYDHSQTSGNPHGTTAADVGADPSGSAAAAQAAAIAAAATDATTKANAKVVQTITNGETSTAPSQDAVHDALAGKSDTSHDHAGVYAPATHASTHASAGSDPISIAASQVTSGVLSIGRLATGTPDGTKFVADDGTLKTPAGGAVDSVNGQTGVVVLDADDLADGTTNHVFTAADDTKLAGIASGATANQSDATTNAAIAAAQAASQPLDAQLTAVAGWTDGAVEAKTASAALWIGTKSAYDALGSWSSTTVYVVT